MIFDKMIHSNIPSKGCIDLLENTIMSNRNIKYQNYRWKIQPINISKTSPEVVLGSGVVLKKDKALPKKENLTVIKPVIYLQNSLPFLIELCETDRNVEYLPSTDFNEEKETPEKDYSDHIYHLRFNLSSAYLNILHIIYALRLNVSGQCVVTGVGRHVCIR